MMRKKDKAMRQEVMARPVECAKTIYVLMANASTIVPMANIIKSKAVCRKSTPLSNEANINI